MDIKTKLSTLWVVIMFNMVFADILSIMVELVNENTLGIIGEDVATTMAVAAIVLSMPILMIYLSRVLSYKINRQLNIIVGMLTIVFVVGGGSLLPHYIILASIEVVLLLIIIKSAWIWVPEKV